MQVELKQRMKNIRQDNDDTQPDLAEKLHVTWHTIASWEQGKSTPSYEMLVAFCRIYKVSADYLLGLTNNPVLEETAPRSVLTPEHQTALKDYEEYLLWRQESGHKK